MEINYQETSKDLLVRIDIHAKYGAANIDQWTVWNCSSPNPDFKILDVGCGSGKQCFLLQRYTQGTGRDHRAATFRKNCSTKHAPN